MQIGKSRTSEDLCRLRKTKNEDSRGLRDLQDEDLSVWNEFGANGIENGFENGVLRTKT